MIEMKTITKVKILATLASGFIGLSGLAKGDNLEYRAISSVSAPITENVRAVATTQQRYKDGDHYFDERLAGISLSLAPLSVTAQYLDSSVKEKEQQGVDINVKFKEKLDATTLTIQLPASFYDDSQWLLRPRLQITQSLDNSLSAYSYVQANFREDEFMELRPTMGLNYGMKTRLGKVGFSLEYNHRDKQKGEDGQMITVKAGVKF